jgi:putative DNA primase/helicase
MTAVDSNFIYEQSTEMYDDLQSPLKNAESAKFLEVMRRLHWETPLNAYYLAGWCVLAPVCGAISWRPHIWLTGIASAGKTWVINSLVKPMITPWVVHVKASVTEAGLRHKLGSDKRPVMVDEFETESQNAQHRAQNVIELARQASSEDDGAIVKGSSNGIAIEYRVNSMFMFSSISVALAQQADENRVSVLTLMDPVTQLDRTQEYKQSHFKDLSSRCAELVNDEYCRGLRARTISLIPIIRKNAKILALAASERLGSTRAGDQYGALLAGAYSLVSDKLITIEKAREWISVNDFTEEERNTESSDSLRCLDLILQHVVRVGSIDFSVAEMLKIVKNVDGESFMCENALLRLGIKYEYDNGSKWIVISNTHKAIGTILRDTSWPKMWGRILKRIHGAVDKKTVRFHDGVRTGAIAIPWNVVYDGD